jgi:hypothetical protein
MQYELTDFERAAIRSLEQFPFSVWAVDELGPIATYANSLNQELYGWEA